MPLTDSDTMMVAGAALAVGLAVGLALAPAGVAVPKLGLHPFEISLVLTVLAALCLALRQGGGSSGAASSPAPGADKLDMTKDDRTNFMTVFEDITASLIQDASTHDMPDRTPEYLQRLVEYNVPKGKLNRGLTVIEALRAIKGQVGAEDFVRASALGWCVEWLQAFFLVADDIMDESETRRGQPCWYKVADVGMVAINDGILLEAHIYVILKKFFGETPLYVPLLELFHEVTYQTSLGQHLDLTTADPVKVDFSRFSMNVYSNIVIYKTAFYTFYLPIALGMRIAGITDAGLYRKARDICVAMGEYFQIQDDYLDCYGDPEVIGKVGTDIKDNKCSWLINTALPLCSAKQRKTLETNYAKQEPKCENAVKKVFAELHIEDKFHAYEEMRHAELQRMISEVEGMPPTIFSQLLERIYKRKK